MEYLVADMNITSMKIEYFLYFFLPFTKNHSTKTSSRILDIEGQSRPIGGTGGYRNGNPN